MVLAIALLLAGPAFIVLSGPAARRSARSAENDDGSDNYGYPGFLTGSPRAQSAATRTLMILTGLVLVVVGGADLVAPSFH
jgi:hypothetical protein